ncbi:hypothetical protein LINPERPRIM_LOCUS23867 [Linum perenne]
MEYHPELRQYISNVLEQLHQITPQNSTNSDVKYEITYPPSSANPVVYASSFCKQSPALECKRCLRIAKGDLLQECIHAVGAQVHSELCSMRYEIYDFFA